MSRQSVIDKSSVMLGRNIYSQGLRQYAIKPYTDGKYYSDCSSFCSAAFMTAGYNVSWNNTTSFKSDNNFYTVPITQNDKQIANASNILKIADVIIWTGHCNMVHHIDGDTVYLQDHGSGNPKIIKLSDAERWNSGYIVVRRLKAFDDEEKAIEIETPVVKEEPKAQEEKTPLYKVQSGAYRTKDAADYQSKIIESKGFSTYIIKKGDLYTIQCGAFKEQMNASNLADKLRDTGLEGYVWLDE